MMEQRTLNIINICKGNTKYSDNHGTASAIKHYMANECAHSADWYTDRDVFDILWTAMEDYLNHCDKPSVFMYNLKWALRDECQMPVAIMSALSLAQVRNDKGYVNGFDDRLNKLNAED